MFKKLILLGALVVATGCVTRGADFPSDTSWIKVGQTSKSDVRSLLGEPFAVGRSQEGETWTYGYYKHRLFRVSNTKELKFYWQDLGKVGSYSFNSSFPDDKRKALGGP